MAFERQKRNLYFHKLMKDVLKALEMWCWKKMQRINLTEIGTNEDVLKTIK